MEKKNTIIIGRKRIPDMKFLELRQKDVINCNTGECLGFVLQMYYKDRKRYDSSQYQKKRMPEIKEKLSFLQKK